MGLNRNGCIHSKWDVKQQCLVAIPPLYVDMILRVSHFYGTFPETT